MGKRQKIVGIDPGLSGGLAFFNGSSLKLHEIPTEKAARGRAVRWDELVTESYVHFLFCHRAYIEQVSTRPGEGGASAFKFGYVAGGLRGIVANARIPTVMVTPQKWKKYFNLGPDKAEAVALAEDLFPANKDEFYGPRGGLRDGLAEAALISFYGYEMEKLNGTG